MSTPNSPSTTLTDQKPSFMQTLWATRTEWEAIYKAVPRSDNSGICGEIDSFINGQDFDARVEVELDLDQLDSAITASIKTGIPLTYGTVKRLICDCGRDTCCLRPAAEDSP